MVSNSNEVLFKQSFSISRKLDKLINDFNFHTDPRDGIKDVRIKKIKVVSTCETCNFSFAVNDNKMAVFDIIKAKNIPTDHLTIKEIDLDIMFYDGVFDKRKKKVPVTIKYFSQIKTVVKNPTINKYLSFWGLVKTQN